jgi:hypothetical protein
LDFGQIVRSMFAKERIHWEMGRIEMANTCIQNPTPMLSQ